MRVVLDIKRLVLEGLPLTALEARRIRNAAERELSHLLDGPPPARLLSGGAVPSVAAPRLNLAPSSTPEAVGIGVARAVHGALVGTE
jgi:hypothetical protein